MATFLNSANFSGYNGSHFRIELWYDILSQSTASNQSVVRYYLYFVSSDGYSAYGSYTSGYINYNWVGGTDSIGANSTVYIGYRDETYAHNQDGTSPLINYYASFDTNWDGVGGSAVAGTYYLPSIQRYAIVTSGTNFNDEENPSVEFTNVGLYPLKAQIVVGNTTIFTQDIQDQTITSYTYELTNAQRNQLRQLCAGKTLTVSLQIISIDGNNPYTSSTNVTMTIVNANPDFTYTAVEKNAKVIALLGTDNANTTIGTASQIEFTFSLTMQKYATASLFNIKEGIAGNIIQNYTRPNPANPYVSNIYPTSLANSGKYIFTLTDSRGFTKQKTDTQRTHLQYNQVRINDYSFKRQNPTSSNVIFNGSFNYWGNIGSYTNTPIVKWKLDDGNWTTIPSSNYVIDSTNHTLTINNYTISNVLPYTDSGQFSISIEDVLTSKTDTNENKGKVLEGIPTFDVGARDFQVNGDLYIADANRDNPVNVLDAINNASKKIYSTNEQEIGEWVNGETLYRKTFTNVLWNENGSHFSTDITNLDEVKNIYGTVEGKPINFVVWFNNVSYYIATWESNGDIYVQCSSAYDNTYGNVTIEYTKTS